MTFVVIAVVVALYCVFFNPTTTRIRKINNVLNRDRTVCDFINEIEGWDISPDKSDGLRIVITPPFGLAKYYLYITYNGERPTNDQIKKLHLELTRSNSMIVQAHKINMPYEEYKEVATASLLGITDMRRYRKYKEWHAEYNRLLVEYGTDSKEANDYFESFFRQINFPDEWKRYSDYQYQKSLQEMRKMFNKPMFQR